MLLLAKLSVLITVLTLYENYCVFIVLFSIYVFHFQTLQDDSISMTQQRDYLRQLLQLNKNYEVLKMKLKENETNAQVSSFCILHKHISTITLI